MQFETLESVAIGIPRHVQRPELVSKLRHLASTHTRKKKKHLY